MQTIEVQTFKYDELSAEAQARAREWFQRASGGDSYWSESVIEDAEQCAELIGITFDHRGQKQSEPCVFWNGFWSQGDGACFEGAWQASAVKLGGMAKHVGDSDSCKELKRIAAEFEAITISFPEASFTVKQSGHYSHSGCTEFNVDFGTAESDGDAEQMNAAEESLIKMARDFMDWIYGQLESAYNYENEDSTIAENIRANEYDFSASGERSVTL